MGHIRIPGIMDWNWPATDAHVVSLGLMHEPPLHASPSQIPRIRIWYIECRNTKTKPIIYQFNYSVYHIPQ